MIKIKTVNELTRIRKLQEEAVNKIAARAAIDSRAAIDYSRCSIPNVNTEPEKEEKVNWEDAIQGMIICVFFGGGAILILGRIFGFIAG